MKKLFAAIAILTVACYISARPTEYRQEWAESTEKGTYQTAEGTEYRYKHITPEGTEVRLLINDNGTIWTFDDVVKGLTVLDGKLNR